MDLGPSRLSSNWSRRYSGSQVEEGWRRQKPQIELTVEGAADLVAGHGFVPARIQPLLEGLANSNFLVEDAGGNRVVLRMLQRAPSQCATEVAVMTWAGTVVPVPAVLAHGLSPAWLLLEWREGRTMQRLTPHEQVAAARSIGESLGRLANATCDRPGFFDADLQVPDPWPSVIDGFLLYLDTILQSEALHQRLGPRAAEVAAAFCEAEPDLRRATAQANLSHSDFKASNLLVLDGQLEAVLDWEFAHAGTWLTDAGQVRRYLGDERAEFEEELELGMTASGFGPPGDWRRLADLIDLLSLLDFLSRPEIGPNQFRQIVGLIDRTLKA